MTQRLPVCSRQSPLPETWMIILYFPPITRKIAEDISDLLFIPRILLFVLIDIIISLLIPEDDDEG